MNDSELANPVANHCSDKKSTFGGAIRQKISIGYARSVSQICYARSVMPDLLCQICYARSVMPDLLCQANQQPGIGNKAAIGIEKSRWILSAHGRSVAASSCQGPGQWGP